MIRYAVATVFAAVLTAGAVSTVNAETPQQNVKVSINKAGQYCVHQPAITGSRIPHVECHSRDNWAKQDVTFSQAPTRVASK